MKGKKREVVFLILFSIMLIISVIYGLFIFSTPVTGFDTSSTGSVVFGILGEPFLKILYPYGNNYTYNFSVGDIYTLYLNLSTDEQLTSFNYTLFDLHHNVTVSGQNNVAFSPNTTFNAVRWTNQLFVTGYTDSGKIARDNVTFFIHVPNSAPIIYGINSSIYICEGSSLFYNFYAFDADEDFLTPSISGNGYFFIDYLGQNQSNLTLNYFLIFSGRLSKNSVGGLNNGSYTHNIAVSASDGVLSDTALPNITVIEINNPLRINPPLGLTVATVWNIGENSTLLKWINISDYEYDSYNYGTHSFNVTITNSTGQLVNLFNLTSVGGNALINFTATNQTPVGVYNVKICVNDTGLTNPNPKILFECGQTGGSATSCDNFQLTVTNKNRQPTIIKHYPDNNKTLDVSGDDTLYFNITKYDPDGTTPDTYWYVNGVFSEIDKGSLVDEFNYRFGCGVEGLQKVKVEITDGELNDSLSWNISVGYVPCSNPPASSGGGGGGGGGAAPRCTPRWACQSWGICQIADVSLEGGLLSGVDYRKIKDVCDLKQISDQRCGFESRECIDLANCSSSFGKPNVVDFCLYVENPSCSDGIKDCHNGDCEVLVDCGGPCKPCPSCSDGLKNQEEEGIDCGGPCPWKCVPEVPLLKRKEVVYGFFIILLLIIIVIVIQLLRVLKYKRALKERQGTKL
jgi:hypothetical protein